MKEELKAKRFSDVEKGVEYREKCVELVNQVLEGEARLKRIHAIIRPSGHKKNTLLNRLTPTNPEDSTGMGLDHLLIPGDSEVNPQFIAIRRFTDPDLYYKMPQGVSLKEFVEIILPQIHFLLFTPKLSKYALVGGGDFNWQRAESRGNERRLSATFKDGPYKDRKVVPERDLHWVKVDGTSKKSFAFGEGFDIPSPPLKEALLRILRRDSE